MSYFVFGNIILRKNVKEKDLRSIGWKIFEKGQKNSLFIFLSPNIPQKILQEMVVEQNGNIEHHLCFLVTDSPVNNVSDELIFSEDMLQEYLNKQRHFLNLSLLSNWICDIFNLSYVESLHLYLSEGYSPDFVRIKTNPENLLEMLVHEINENQEYYDLPSVIFEIERNRDRVYK